MINLASKSIEINGTIYFTQNRHAEISLKCTHSFNFEKAIVSDTIYLFLCNCNLHINPIQSVYLFSLQIFYMVHSECIAISLLTI